MLLVMVMLSPFFVGGLRWLIPRSHGLSGNA